MKIGIFQAPFVSPARSPREVFEWAVKSAIIADQAKCSEYWIGEHSTLSWESVPNPELVIAAAADQTTQLKIGPLAHLLPYYHPATLAIQTSWMSHILKGRYQLGVATGAYASDGIVHGIKDMKVNFPMMLEALDIMEKVWLGEPFFHEGKYWDAGWPDKDPNQSWRDPRPYGGKIPMAMTGLSAPSTSLAFAASRGWIPCSVYTSDESIRSHFETYREESAKQGRTVDRSVHRVARDILIADTDAEAKRLAIKHFGPVWKNYLQPVFHRFGLLQGMLTDKSVKPEDVNAEYLAEHVWIVGSPETVRQKIQDWFGRLGGGFGMLLAYGHEFMDDPKPWEESVNRLVQEVAPKIHS
jgi:alkanesulfonate monooxygenase SsuD/methylene tetrahydromethanopterin reductase-like flavin-dependent oxidoreductase (luciferase family)